MYPPLTLLSIAALLPVLLASALPHLGSDIVQRAPSVLEKKITLNLQQVGKTRYASKLLSALELVQSDEITDDESVQVYDVTNLNLGLKAEQRQVVARTMKDNSKIKMNWNLKHILVAYGHDGAKDEADRRWWLLHIRPDQPRELYWETDPIITLHWKEKQNSDTEWKKSVLHASKRYGDWPINGIYVTYDWIDQNTGKKKTVEVITRPDRDGSEMTPDEVKTILNSRDLLAYGFEATTELYTKRWWIVTEPSERKKKSTTE